MDRPADGDGPDFGAPDRPDRPAAGAVAAITGAALVLLPYATVGLTFRTALYVQAAGILAVVAAATAAGLWLRGRLRPARAPAGFGLGLAGYALAAGLGAAVGLAAGNRSELVAGQLLSMALLPLGAVAGLALGPRRTWGWFAAGLLVGAGAASLIHVADWAWSAAHGRPVLRLFLDNSVTLSGLVLPALLLGLAAVAAPRRLAAGGAPPPPPRAGPGTSESRRGLLTRAGAWLGLALAAAYLLGSGVRGLWVVALPSLAAYLVLAGTGLPRRRVTVLAAAGLSLCVASAWAFHLWLGRERPNLLAPGGSAPAPEPRDLGLGGDPPARRWTWNGAGGVDTLIGPLPVPGPGTYRLRMRIGGGDRGAAIVALRWHNAWRDRVGALTLHARPFARRRWLEAVGAAPPGTESADLVVSTRGAAAGTWTLAQPRLELLGRSLPALPVAQAAYLDRRLQSLASLLARPGLAPDVSVASRRAETRVVRERFAAASWPRKLLGHGLGATFEPADAASPAAAAGHGGAQNYLHNFYAFLLFKLGLGGSLLVASSLLLWLGSLVGWAWRAPPGRPRRFLAASAGAWVGYLLLAVSSPEILNFRVAPVLGLMLAASAGARDTADAQSR